MLLTVSGHGELWCFGKGSSSLHRVPKILLSAVTSNNFLAISSSAVLLPSSVLWYILTYTHTTLICTQVWYNCIMLIIVVELRTSGGFCRWGFCISFIHNIQEVSLGFVVLCNIFFHHRSSKMANELRIFSSCKRIISSQNQIKEWWMNDEFVIIWKKVVVALLGYCLGICRKLWHKITDGRLQTQSRWAHKNFCILYIWELYWPTRALCYGLCAGLIYATTWKVCGNYRKP